jgi:hypothetical protein
MRVMNDGVCLAAKVCMRSGRVCGVLDQSDGVGNEALETLPFMVSGARSPPNGSETANHFTCTGTYSSCCQKHVIVHPIASSIVTLRDTVHCLTRRS